MININAILEEDCKEVKKKEETEQKSNNIINIEKNNEIENKKLNKEEILKAKENGFILIGKTGVGKTTLLNLIYKDNVGKVGHSTKSETIKSNYYCIKEKVKSDDIYFCIIDTPGLFDTNGIKEDTKQKEDIKNLISREKIKIKGLLFLTNYQNERFDFSEQDTLIQYNAIFPLKEFWKRIILIFTHYYGDPDGDTKEDILNKSNKILPNIINNIMNKVKNVSYPLSFFEIKKKYINIYSNPRTIKQIESNEDYRKDIILDIIQLTNSSPMFSKLEIFHFEKYEIKENDNYLYDCDLNVYLDANGNVVHKEFFPKNKYKKNAELLNSQKITLNIEDCLINKDGNLIKNHKKKEGYKEIFKNINDKISNKMTIVSLIGLVFSGLFFPQIAPLCMPTLLGGLFINESYDQQEKEKKKIDTIMKDQNIYNEIKKQIKDNY